jgi:AcrR family transcriptional regulator
LKKHSLRELKKEATAHALATAAYRLTLERGLDGFVVEDVVKLAGFSRRTFANHYACKEEAVVMAAVPFDGMDEAEAYHADLPENSTPLEVVYLWLKMPFTAELFRKLRDLIPLSERYPTLTPYILIMYSRLLTEAHESLQGLIQGRYPEGYSHQLIGAVYGAILPIIDGRLRVRFPGDPPDDDSDVLPFEQYLDTTFGYLRHGF